MALGMKHELDHEQYRTLLKEIRKFNDKLDCQTDLLFIIAASRSSKDPCDIVKNAGLLKKEYLNSKYGTLNFPNTKKGEEENEKG